MSLSLGESIWERRGWDADDILSQRAYIFAVSGFTVLGMLVASFIAYMTLHWHPLLFEVITIGLAMPILGIFIAFMCDQWGVSLFGYFLVVGGIGAICGPTVNLYESGVVINALLATCGVSVAMSIVGIIIPQSLEHWGGYLFGILTAVVLVSIARLFFPASAGPLAPDADMYSTMWHYLWLGFDYFVAVLFCIYIIFDWNRALRLPRTLDNAVDCSVAIFLDVVNLFVRILSIMGRKK